ncbi:hypothetical protein HY634_04310 [Candidatus Uhrbacteria bacterium]|nr:hypothetical protein [Candidatus Uhrbacteria bacterium]
MTKDEANTLVLRRLHEAGFPGLRADDALTDDIMLNDNAMERIGAFLSPSEDVDGEEVPLLFDASFLEAHARVMRTGATVHDLIELVRIRSEIIDACRSATT